MVTVELLMKPDLSPTELLIKPDLSKKLKPLERYFDMRHTAVHQAVERVTARLLYPGLRVSKKRSSSALMP